MRRNLLGGFLLSCLLALTSGVSPVRAQEHPPAAGARERESASHTYRVEVLKGNEEEEKVFHMDDRQQAAELTDLLRNGQIESLEREKPMNILAIRWDLGLWTVVVFLLLLWILGRLA